MVFVRKHATILTGLGCLIILTLLPAARTLSQKNTGRQRSESRRNVLIQGFQAVAFTAVVDVQPALALKERNEALCGTGFFTNIAQYMCTDIGDISDEGKSRKITDSELSSMDSLLGKLGAPEETVQKNDQVQDMGKETSSSTEQN